MKLVKLRRNLLVSIRLRMSLDLSPPGNLTINQLDFDLRLRRLETKGKEAEMGQDQSSEKKKFTPVIEIPPGAEVIGNYLVENVLGKGSFAEVKLGKNLKTGEKVALKFIQKQNLNKGKRRVHLQREIRFLKLISHPHISLLFDVIEQEEAYVLIMEHVGGGELLDFIRNSPQHRIAEKESRKMFRQIISAVDYCHQNNLIHRDIKPENVLLDEHKDVKIIDFGFSREFTADMQLDSFIGSPHYAAPELLQGIKYTGAEVDIWSLGILLYVMVCGKQPFKHPDMKVLYAKITKGVFEYPDFLSESCKDLISAILQVDPKKRLTMEQIKNHPWTCEGFPGPPSNYLEPRPHLTTLDEDILEELLKYSFNKDEAPISRPELVRVLLSNEAGPIKNFYHLIAERKIQMQLLDEALPERRVSTAEDMDIDSKENATMVTRVENDERVPISAVEKNIRRQMIRRESEKEMFRKGQPRAFQE